MRLSIKTKLLAGFLAVITVIMVAIFGVVAVNFMSQAMESARRSALGELSQVDAAISLFLDESRMNADMMARTPLAARLDEITTSHAKTTSPRKARPDEGDEAGREFVRLFQAVQGSHPAYVEVFAGNRNGAFVSALEDSEMPAGYDPRKRPWYVEALPITDRPSMSKAYMSTTGEAVTSVTRTVTRGSEALGVLGIDISLKKLTDLTKSIKLGKSGYLVLVQGDGVVLADPSDEKNNFKKAAEATGPVRELSALGEGWFEFASGGKDYLGAVVASPKSGWKLLGVIDRAEVEAPVRATLLNLTLLAALSLGLLALAGRIFSMRVIIRPLEAVSAFLERIKQGDYAHRVAHSRPDEMGVILDSLNAMAEVLGGNMEEIRRKTEDSEQKAQAAGQASREAEEARLQAEQARREGMLQAASKLEGVVSVVGSASQELSVQIEQSSRGAESQAQRVSETATAMEEMSATVLEVARNAAHAAQTADTAKSKAREGAGVVNEALEGMREVQGQSARLKEDMDRLGSQARDIGRVLTVISDIADQTNLLALNAAIEAARAGEAGRGFAVVADEVRKLAEKTMQATREVGEAIGAIQQSAKASVDNVERSVGLIGHAAGLSEGSGRSLGEIMELVDLVTDQVRSIATASEEQSAASEQIGRSIEQVNVISEETSQAMGLATRAVNELAEQAQVLRALIDDLHGEGGGGRKYAARELAGLAAPTAQGGEAGPPARLGEAGRVTRLMEKLSGLDPVKLPHSRGR